MAIRQKTKMTIPLQGKGTSHASSEIEVDGNTVVIDEPQQAPAAIAAATYDVACPL